MAKEEELEVYVFKGKEQIDALRDITAKAQWGRTVTEAKQKGICVACGKVPETWKFSEAGRREFKISQVCEPCYDEMFSEDGKPGDRGSDWGLTKGDA